MPKRKSSDRTSSEEDQSQSKHQRSQDHDSDHGKEAKAVDLAPAQAREAEVGIIERILLKNFMCHGLLDVKLGPHVNFIIGRNGSGKSAVVTGLVVGLGGNATTASRGSRVRSFVKTGKHTAEVEIRLRNIGPDAYKYEQYGDSIIIQRKILADGGSRYYLRSADGKLVSDKREELTKVTEFFNIQVNNPVAILNQDTSRNFLHSKNPADKYKFFLKATQLEQMKNEYDEANASKAKTDLAIQHAEKTLPALRDEVSKWEKKFMNLGTITQLKKKVKALKHEMAWAFVAEREKGLSPLQKDMRNEELRTPKFIQKADESKAKVDECQERLKTVKEQLLAVTNEAELLKPRLKEKRDTLSAAKVAQRDAQNETRNIEKDLRSIMSDRKQIQQRIKELQQTAQHDYEAERFRRQEKIKNMQEQLRDLEKRSRLTKHEMEQYESAVTKHKAECHNIGNEEAEKRRLKTTCEQAIHTLEAARSNRVKRFGAWVPNALAKIDEYARHGKFHKKPRGPLGSCFQLKDQNWALAAESCLRSLIHAFVCNDHEDERVLEQIFAETGNRTRPPIITCRFKDSVHDVSRYCVKGSKYPTVLDMVECDDPVIMNALIDQRGIENVILIPEAPEARQVMMRKPPQNCKEAFTREGDHLYCQPTFRNYSSDMSVARFLTSDVEEEIKVQQQLNARLGIELQKLGQQKQKLQRDITCNQREAQRSETQLLKINESISNLTYELNELKTVEEPLPADISTLDEDVQNYTQQIEELERRKGVAAAFLEEKTRLCAEADREFRSIEKELKLRANSDIPLKEELNNAQQALDDAQHSKKYYHDKLKDHEHDLAQLQKCIEDLKKEIESDIGKATQIHAERIPTQRTPTNIDREITQINLQIRQEEETQGDPEEITRRYEESKARYMEIKKTLKGCKKFLQCLSKGMERRNKAYVDFKRMIALRVRCFFLVMLLQRKYTGSMKFNHSTQTLELWVAPTEASEQNKDLKALSGGERSFSTVCYILSLWSAMESPFRCLDEFDVFMDLVVRRFSMDMMLEMTRNQLSKQFIFLTPQDLSNMNMGVVGRPRIFQMPDPDRTAHGQTALPFGKD